MLVAELCGDLVVGVIDERHSSVFGLQPVDEVAEDPAASAEALSIAAFLAEATPPAGADTRHQHPVARGDRGNAGTHLLDGAYGLVAEHDARCGLGHISLEDMQVGAADRRGVDPHDRVGRVEDRGIIDRVPASLARTVIHEGLHLRFHLWLVGVR